MLRRKRHRRCAGIWPRVQECTATASTGPISAIDWRRRLIASVAPLSSRILRLIELPCHDCLLVIEHNQEQSCQTMKLKRAIAAVVLASAFAAPVTAGTFEDALDAHARGDY